MDRIKIHDEVYVSTAVAKNMLDGLVSTKALRKAAKEMGWQYAKIKGKWWYRESDVSFPDWPMSSAQHMFVTFLFSKEPDKVSTDVNPNNFTYYQAKAFLSNYGISTPQIITIDGFEVAKAYGRCRRPPDAVILVAELNKYIASIEFYRPPLRHAFSTETTEVWTSDESQLTMEKGRELIDRLLDAVGDDQQFHVPHDGVVQPVKKVDSPRVMTDDVELDVEKDSDGA